MSLSAAIMDLQPKGGYLDWLGLCQSSKNQGFRSAKKKKEMIRKSVIKSRDV